MASRSLGEALLRPSSLTYKSHTSYSQCLRRTTPSWTAQRSISATCRRSAQPQRKDDFEYVPEREADGPQRGQPSEQPSGNRPTQANNFPFGNLPTNRPRPTFMSRDRPATSSDDMYAARARKTFGSDFLDGSRPRTSRRTPGLDFDSMALPDSILNPSLSNKPSEAASLATQQEETFSNYPRLRPTYGRTVDLDASRGRDLVRGIGMLGSLVSRNRVRSDFNKQKFHERGGLKRKRLASERYRARFKKGFRAVTGRVTELTKKGW